MLIKLQINYKIPVTRTDFWGLVQDKVDVHIFSRIANICFIFMHHNIQQNIKWPVWEDLNNAY